MTKCLEKFYSFLFLDVIHGKIITTFDDRKNDTCNYFAYFLQKTYVEILEIFG